jgi:hypothetical protein
MVRASCPVLLLYVGKTKLIAFLVHRMSSITVRHTQTTDYRDSY